MVAWHALRLSGVCVLRPLITHGAGSRQLLGYEPADRALCSYFAIAALHATSVNALRRCTLQA